MPNYSSGIINIPNVTGDIVITAIATAATVSSISAVFNQGQNVIYDTDSLDTLKQYLTVTATYTGGATAVVTGYTLSGTLAEGTSAITVAYGGKTTTFSVIVTEGKLYPFANGTKTFSDGSILTISNRNHVKYECKSTFTGSGAGNPFFNVSDTTMISTDDLNNPDSVNYKPTLFSFSSGQSVVFSIDNVVSTGSNAYEIQSNLRIANTNQSYTGLGLAVTSASGGSKTVTASATNIACAFLFFTKCTANEVYEFDMHLVVDGVSYF